jgi:predicted transcriptional regulator/DNA-binding XRE family transcriptional regulator
MAGDASLLGPKVRGLRRRENMTQSQLADKLGISPSYLNLIENNRRPLTAPILIKLAQLFQLDLHTFAGSDDQRLVADLLEVFGDPLFESHGLTNVDVRELAASSPAAARAVLTLYRAFRAAREQSSTMAAELSADGVTGVGGPRLPNEEVNDLLQRHMNYFPELEAAAEDIWKSGKFDEHDVYQGLVQLLERTLGVTVHVVRAAAERSAVRRYDPARKVLTVSEILPPRTRRFQLAHQIGLLSQGAVLERITRDATLSTPGSLSLARVALANYFAGALLMPYEPFVEACRAERYDIEVLAHRFGTSFEQVCHRLTTLRRRGMEGVPFHMLRIDIAGNISKRFSGDGIRFARFSGACPRWNVHAAFLTPGMIRVQLSRMPDGALYFCVARTVRNDRGGWHAAHVVQSVGLGCRAEHARELVYADGVDLSNTEAAVKVGTTCRLCEHADCEQRVFPPMHLQGSIDENVRGVSFYAPVSATRKLPLSRG